MPRYFFDLRDGDGPAVDEEGLELRAIQAVPEEAAGSFGRHCVMRSAGTPTVLTKDTAWQLRCGTPTASVEIHLRD
jgi:hypothetical protein